MTNLICVTAYFDGMLLSKPHSYDSFLKSAPHRHTSRGWKSLLKTIAHNLN